MSFDLLSPSDQGQKILHDLESIFWVLVHIVWTFEPQTPIQLQNLLSSKPSRVYACKVVLIRDFKKEMVLHGPFRSIGPFLSADARACWDHVQGSDDGDKAPFTFDKTFLLLDEALSSLRPSAVPSTTDKQVAKSGPPPHNGASPRAANTESSTKCNSSRKRGHSSVASVAKAQPNPAAQAGPPNRESIEDTPRKKHCTVASRPGEV